MERPRSDRFTSILLVNNLHCPSCVSYAKDILRSVSSLEKVTISLVNHEIRFEHHHRKTVNEAIRELENGAFEIQHARIIDSEGKTSSELATYGNSSERPLLHTWPLFMPRAQRKHIENCSVCRTETAHRSKKAKIWAAIRRRDKSFDVEKQDSFDSSSALVDGAASTNLSDQNPINAEPSHGEISTEFTVFLSIGGMTCASCSGTITKELNSLDFVTNVNINLLTNSGRVTYLGPKENSNKILDSVEEVGYEASVNEIKPYLAGDHPKSLSHNFVASVSIEGMTCGSCVGTIIEGLKALSFIHEVNIDLVGNSGKVAFEGKENIEKIVERIEDIGYGAAVAQLEPQDKLQINDEAVTERTITIAIEGMFCEHCPENIMSVLKERFRDLIVVDQPVTFQNPRVRVRYTPSPPHLTIRRLVRAISSTHEAFSAKIWHAPTIEERSRAMQLREERRILARLFFTFLIAIPTLVIGVIYMSLLPESDPTKMWFEEPVWAGNVSRTEWALFLMTTPVMFFGADIFHIHAFKELKALWRPGSRVPIFRRLYRFGSMNLLISAGTAVAYFSSVAILVLDSRTVPRHVMGSQSSTYFDTVTFLSFFILIGKFLEAYSKAKAGDAVAMLSKLRPDEALLVESATEGSSTLGLPESERVQIDMLEVGDKVKVLHGASPPTDGIVTSAGTFLFDESSLNGESNPVKKVAGDQIFAGSVNISQPAQMKVASIGGTSMLDKVVAVVREGQTKRAPVERIVDTITGYFVPVITLLAVITFVVWLGLGLSGALPARYLSNAQGGWTFWSLEFAIAVFVVACPCGLGLAAPTALFVGGGLAAKHGILVRGGGEAFQEASRLDVVVFDKTGTLTEGQMKVTDFEMVRGEREKDEEQLLVFALSKAMEESSIHPIARAILLYCAEKDLKDIEIADADIIELPGQGMRGKFTVRQRHAPEGETIYEAAVGSQRLLSSLQEANRKGEDGNMYLDTTLSRFQTLGQSTAILYLRRLHTVSNRAPPSFEPVAVFAISDPIRPSAQSVLSTLRHRHNLEVHMCTGDNPTTALTVASQLSIPPTNVRAGVMPMDKAAYIKELQQQQQSQEGIMTYQTRSKAKGKSRRKIVAFIGDGTNDTPALSAADVSIALSSGSDIAVSTSSFILLNTDLATLVTLVDLATRVFSRVKWNFLWAALYNVILVPVAAGVFFRLGDLDGKGTGWRLGPVWASAAMALSSVSVVVSSLALRLPPFMTWWRLGRRAKIESASSQ